MRLDTGVIRELHWHKEAEWAYVLEGEVRVTALDYEGGNFIDDLKKGDLWYFPSGVPHSLQGLGENGTEFLLIFDDGRFSEESTFILTDWLGKLIFSFTRQDSWLTRRSSSHAQVGHCQKLQPRPRSLCPPARGRKVHLPGLPAGLH
jgi:oxalate decarboxylase/phosphoglucose isomerase-like protein (cupin superfamily)